MYLTANSLDDRVHWFSITNSIMIVLFLTVMIAMILLRALRKDIAQYNDPNVMEEAKEESGWKLVHGDVFRPPSTMLMLFRSVGAWRGTRVFVFYVVLFVCCVFIAHLPLPFSLSQPYPSSTATATACCLHRMQCLRGI